jgi:TolA-binding protein
MEEPPMFRHIVFASVLVLIAGLSHAAPPAAGSSSASSSDSIVRQLRDTRVQVQTQRAQTAQLKSRVSELEQRSAAEPTGAARP